VVPHSNRRGKGGEGKAIHIAKEKKFTKQLFAPMLLPFTTRRGEGKDDKKKKENAEKN